MGHFADVVTSQRYSIYLYLIHVLPPSSYVVPLGLESALSGNVYFGVVGILGLLCAFNVA
jgi:hypothetical protein